MKIAFYLKDIGRIERTGCDKEDMVRLVSQFNNGHLMRVGNLCINPKEVICFMGYECEEE